MNGLDSFEHQIRTMIETDTLPRSEVKWLDGVLRPNQMVNSTKHNQQLQLMLSALLQYKFPELDPQFVIAWIPKVGYKIGFKIVTDHEPKQ